MRVALPCANYQHTKIYIDSSRGQRRGPHSQSIVATNSSSLPRVLEPMGYTQLAIKARMRGTHEHSYLQRNVIPRLSHSSSRARPRRPVRPQDRDGQGRELQTT